MSNKGDEIGGKIKEQEPLDIVPAIENPNVVIIDGGTPYISIHALNGFLFPSTLKITGKIHGKEVMVLIDSGSTNNFIQNRWANHLNLSLQPSSHLHVMVRNGEVLTCGSRRVPASTTTVGASDISRGSSPIASLRSKHSPRSPLAVWFRPNSFLLSTALDGVREWKHKGLSSWSITTKHLRYHTYINEAKYS